MSASCTDALIAASETAMTLIRSRVSMAMIVASEDRFRAFSSKRETSHPDRIAGTLRASVTRPTLPPALPNAATCTNTWSWW